MSYAEAFQRARQDADGFWAEQARAVAWYQAPTRILDTLQDGTHRWFGDGVLNTSYLALDHQIEQGRGEQDLGRHLSVRRKRAYTKSGYQRRQPVSRKGAKIGYVRVAAR